MAAPALELHRRAPEEPHVVLREAAAEHLFHGTAQQVLGAQALDAALRLFPDLTHPGVVITGRVLRKLLDEDAGTAFAVRREEHARGKLLRAGEVGLERARQGIAAQRHDPLVAHAALVRFHRDGEATFAADQAAKQLGGAGCALVPARMRGERSGQSQRLDGRLVEARDGTQAVIVGALRNQQAHRAIALQLQRQLTAKLQRGGKQHRGGNGLPEELPVLRFGGSAVFGSAHWKVDAIDEYAGDRALAWIDDNIDETCTEWAARREAPTLLVPTESDKGLEEGHVEALVAWVEGGFEPR